MKCLVSVVISHGSWMKSFRLRPSGFVQLQVMYAPLSSSVPQDSGILGGLKVPEVPATFNHQSWGRAVKDVRFSLMERGDKGSADISAFYPNIKIL